MSRSASLYLEFSIGAQSTQLAPYTSRLFLGSNRIRYSKARMLLDDGLGIAVCVVMSGKEESAP